MNFTLDNFENDENVIGKWEFYNTTKSIEIFHSQKIQNKSAFSDIIYFLPDGEGYWIYEGWTRGKLFVHFGGDEPILTFSYQLRKVENKLFMFINVGKEHLVYEKKSGRKFSKDKISRQDNVKKYRFENDERVLGKWMSVGFVERPEEFDNKKDYQKDLWLKSVEFFEQGKVKRTYFEGTDWDDKWTNGCLYDLKKNTISKYFLKEINGKTYLFLEWKMGNYVYGGKDPEYYVFLKENEL